MQIQTGKALPKVPSETAVLLKGGLYTVNPKPSTLNSVMGVNVSQSRGEPSSVHGGVTQLNWDVGFTAVGYC